MTGPQQPEPAAEPPYAPPGWGTPQPQGWSAGYGPVPQPGAPLEPAAYGPQQTESKAVVALLLAVASFVAFPLVPAVAALLLGSSARRDIAASGGRLGGDGLVTVARAIAWVNIALCALAALAIAAIVALALSGARFS